MRVHIAKTIDSKVYTSSLALPDRFFPFSLWWRKKGSGFVRSSISSKRPPHGGGRELRNMILDGFISHMCYSCGILLALWKFNL